MEPAGNKMLLHHEIPFLTDSGKPFITLYGIKIMEMNTSNQDISVYLTIG